MAENLGMYPRNVPPPSSAKQTGFMAAKSLLIGKTFIVALESGEMVGGKVISLSAEGHILELEIKVGDCPNQAFLTIPLASISWALAVPAAKADVFNAEMQQDNRRLLRALDVVSG